MVGDLAVDDRGEVGFVNDFDFAGVKRFYTVRNHQRASCAPGTPIGGRASTSPSSLGRHSSPPCRWTTGSGRPRHLHGCALRFVRGARPRVLYIPAGLCQRVHVADRRRAADVLLDVDSRGEPGRRHPIRCPILGHLDGRRALTRAAASPSSSRCTTRKPVRSARVREVVAALERVDRRARSSPSTTGAATGRPLC